MKNERGLLALGSLFFVLAIVIASALNGITFIGVAGVLGIVGSICIFLGLNAKKQQDEAFYNSMIEKMITKNTENTNQLKETLLGNNAEISAIKNELSKVATEMVNVSEQLKQNNTAIAEVVVTLKASTQTILDSSRDQVAKIDQDIEQVRKELTYESQAVTDQTKQLAQLLEQGIKNSSKIANSITDLNNIPNEMMDAFDKIVEEVENLQEEQRDLFEDLTESVEENNQKVTRDMTKKFATVAEDFSNVGQNMEKVVTEMAQQYKHFEKYSDAVVNKLTLMSQNDIKAMRKLVNGK